MNLSRIARAFGRARTAAAAPARAASGPTASGLSTLWAVLLFAAGTAALALATGPEAYAQQRGAPVDGVDRPDGVQDVRSAGDDGAGAEAPTLVDRYRAARHRMLVQDILQRANRGLPALSPVWLATPADSLRPAAPTPVARRADTDTTGVVLTDVRHVRKLERGWFEQRFADTRWSFLGSGRYFTPFDTTRTRDLRARLQAQFGDPTQTLGDRDDLRTTRDDRDDYVQFEYWFVVNDSIPVKVTDANGPYDRGLIVVADARYRDRLFALRQTLLRPLHQPRRAPYVDYYYDAERRRWYRTGFDGQTFFVDRVSRFQIVPGRRPQLDVPSTDPLPTDTTPANTTPAAADTTSRDPAPRDPTSRDPAPGDTASADGRRDSLPETPSPQMPPPRL